MKPAFYLPYIYCVLFLANFSCFAQHFTAINITSGSNSSIPSCKTVFKNKLYLFGIDSSNKYYHLYCIDSNDNLTRVFSQPISERTTVWNIGMAVSKKNGQDEFLFFPAKSDTHGYELFKYDGIAQPTLVHDIETGPQSSEPRQLREMNNKIYFLANHNSGTLTDLMNYNPATGTLTIQYKYAPWGIFDIFALYTFDSRVYLRVDHSIYGIEPWIYNPVTDSLHILAEIYAGANGDSQPTFLDTLNGKIYFSAREGSAPKYELYEHTGTKNIKKLTVTGQSVGLIACFYKGSLYFEGAENAHPAAGLCKYTPATSQFSYVNSLGNKSNALHIGAMKVYKNSLYFSADRDTSKNQDIEMWRYDGVNPPILVANILPASSSNPVDFVEYAGNLYFTAWHSQYGYELYKLLDWPIGINNVKFYGDIALYPNPANSTINIMLNLQKPETVQIEIYNIAGKSMSFQEPQSFRTGNQRFAIDIKNYPPATYIVRLKSSHGILLYSGTFIKH